MIERRRLLFGNAVELLPIGGRIFYDDGDNGATYIFYDSSGNVISDISISGLANATQYSILGTPTKDRFYVYDNTTHTTNGKTATNGLVQNICWGYVDITTGIKTDGIGKGKTNTEAILAITDTSEYSDSIFKYIKACNTVNLNGCNDWYIGSMAEQYQLYRTQLVYDWYRNKYIWSSVEYSRSTAYWWDNNNQDWADYNYTKAYSGPCVFAVRSF